MTIVDDDDEHLSLSGVGFRGRVVQEGSPDWQEISSPDAIVRYAFAFPSCINLGSISIFNQIDESERRLVVRVWIGLRLKFTGKGRSNKTVEGEGLIVSAESW